ncbi:MAG TPA: outer membrane protein assembly factor BamD [Gammaproteobacteria bacterium]|nr:outer membrane protein assembly factor BamD [Gammaproteobacteria bacterium]
MTLTKLLRALPLLLVIVGCSSLGNSDDPDAGAAELYQEARAAMRAKNNETAIERFETLQSRYPFGEHAQQAQLDIIYLYFKTDDWDAAISAADRFIRLNPTHPRVDYALYMRGSANMERGQDFLNRTFHLNRAIRDPRPLRQAFADFQRLATDYPGSDYTDDARRRMVILRNQLADHELAVARYYQSSSAYVAAANRAKGIIENFQETPAVEAALTILADAYQHLDLPDLRQDVLRIIRQNYPNHPLAKQAE